MESERRAVRVRGRRLDDISLLKRYVGPRRNVVSCVGFTPDGGNRAVMEIIGAIGTLAGASVGIAAVIERICDRRRRRALRLKIVQVAIVAAPLALLLWHTRKSRT